MKKIILVRHAQSEENAGLTATFSENVQLSNEGVRQAEEYASRFMESPELIVYSEFIRTLQTASPLIKKFPNALVEEWKGVHEMLYLSQEKSLVLSNHQRQLTRMNYWATCNPDYKDGEDAESFVEFITRVQNFLERLSSRAENKITVFTHGHFIRAVVWCIINKNNESTKDFMEGFVKFMGNYPIGNCETSEIVCNNDMWTVKK